MKSSAPLKSYTKTSKQKLPISTKKSSKLTTKIISSIQTTQTKQFSKHKSCPASKNNTTIHFKQRPTTLNSPLITSIPFTSHSSLSLFNTTARNMSTTEQNSEVSVASQPTTTTTTTPLKIDRFHVSQRFCEAACHGPMVHLAGQLADDLSLDIIGQTKQTLENIDKFLSSAGTNKANILSVTIYLKDMKDYNALNQVWDEWVVPGQPPARTCVQAAMYTPECLVEMSVVAVRDV
jgi:enamine deaminase RidA (YjgF/YER057c/UK114 family)